jgi:hypothetical protein
VGESAHSESWRSFADFMAVVQRARDALRLREHQDPFFRGHSDSSYTLLPSLFRQTCCKTDEEFWSLERRTFFQFRALARELHSDTRSDWDVLFHMQHHGVPTRLLDWTSVFGVALYFALSDNNANARPCIWLLNPYALNKAVWNTYNLFSPKYLARDEEGDRSYDFGELLIEAHRNETTAKSKNWGRLPWDRPLAIYDVQRSERMFVQSGWFTIHGTDFAPLEKIFPNRPEILSKVEIPNKALAAAKEFLALAGINQRQLFPGLDSLAKSVKERFTLQR